MKTIQFIPLLLAIAVISGCSGSVKKTQDGYEFTTDIKDNQGIEIKTKNHNNPIPESTVTPTPSASPTPIAPISPDNNPKTDVKVNPSKNKEKQSSDIYFSKEKEKVVNDYTQSLLNKNYDLAYSFLSDRFRQQRAGDFDNYKTFWTKTNLESLSSPKFLKGNQVFQAWRINGKQRNLIFTLVGSNGSYLIDQVS